MKVCSKCGIELSLDNFHKNKGNKDGMSGSCKGCANERSKAWQKANAKRVKANGKKWYEANLERTKATSRAWYLASAEKHKTASSTRYRENPERVNTAARIWNKANPEKAKSANKKWYNSNSERLKATAKARYDANPEQAKATNTARYEANPEKQKAASKAWREANLEHAKATNRIWHEANPEKAKQYYHRYNATKRSLLSTLTVTQWEDITEHFNHKCCYCGEEKTLHQEHFLALSKGGEYTHNNIVPACKNCNSSKNKNTFFEWYPSFKHYSRKREKLILDYLGYHNTTQQLLSLIHI